MTKEELDKLETRVRECMAYNEQPDLELPWLVDDMITDTQVIKLIERVKFLEAHVEKLELEIIDPEGRR